MLDHSCCCFETSVINFSFRFLMGTQEVVCPFVSILDFSYSMRRSPLATALSASSVIDSAHARLSLRHNQLNSRHSCLCLIVAACLAPLVLAASFPIFAAHRSSIFVQVASIIHSFSLNCAYSSMLLSVFMNASYTHNSLQGHEEHRNP